MKYLYVTQSRVSGEVISVTTSVLNAISILEKHTDKKIGFERDMRKKVVERGIALNKNGIYKITRVWANQYLRKGE